MTQERSPGPALITEEILERLEVLGRSAPDVVENHGAFDESLEPWGEPAPLAGGPRPPFPTEVLPPIVRDRVEATGESYQVPADLVACFALGALSTAAGHLSVEVRPGWSEPMALYLAGVAESGEGKGPVLKVVTAPLEAIQRERQDAAREGVAIGQARYLMTKRQLDRAIGDASKPGAGLAERVRVDDCAAELARLDSPELPRMLADDVTPEALVSLMARNRGRIAVISDEGGLFDTIDGRRYSNGVANLDAVLKAWGRLPIRVDRKGRASESILAPVLTIALAVQPIVATHLANDPQLRGRGLPARFLYFWPATMLGHRRMDTARVSEEVERAWDGLIRRLADGLPAEPAELPPASSSAGSAGFAGSAGPGIALALTPEARRIHGEFRGYLEPRLAPDAGDLYQANGWAAKLPGQVARIAGLLHLAEHSVDGLAHAIGCETMEAAVAIGYYLIDHALAVFGLDGPGGALAPDARRVIHWIERKSLHEFSHREAFDALRSKTRPRSDDWQPVLKLLGDLGYLRPRSDNQGSRGGRPPSPTFSVNPSLLERP